MSDEVGRIGKGADLRITRIMRKYWKSFQGLKIYFLESNFLENNTPLVILDFTMHMAIQLILLGVN